MHQEVAKKLFHRHLVFFKLKATLYRGGFSSLHGAAAPGEIPGETNLDDSQSGETCHVWEKIFRLV